MTDSWLFSPRERFSAQCTRVYPTLPVYPAVHHPGYTTVHTPHTTGYMLHAVVYWVRKDTLGSSCLGSLGSRLWEACLAQGCHASSEVLPGLDQARTGDNG